MASMKTLGTEFKVGLFAIVALAALGYMFFVLSPDMFSSKEQKIYYTELKNAAGIVAKTHVKTSGVTVGKVNSVTLEGFSTRVEFEVDQSVKIPLDSRVEIRAVGLLGDKHLEIIRSEDTGQYIADKGFVAQSIDGSDLESLQKLLGEVGRDVKKITNSLANVLGTKEGEQKLTDIVDNIHGITQDVRATTTTLKKAIGDRDEDMQEIVSGVRDGVRDLRTFAHDLRGVLDKDNRDKIDRILSSFDTTMVDVKAAAKNINLVSEKVEKGEGTIGRLVNDDNALIELEGAIKDIRKVLAPATKLQITMDYHGEVRRDESSQHFFNVLFRTRPDRYYLIGLTDTTYRRRETRLSSSNSDGKDDAIVPEDREDGTVTEERIKDEKQLKFNLQIAKRWYWATARFGLFESRGGIGADFHVLNDRLKFTAEAFDWDTQDKSLRRSAHIKAYVSALFYNHIYAMAGVDDPTRTDPKTGKVTKKTNWFAGAGFSFDDDDLKAIFGTAALAGGL